MITLTRRFIIFIMVKADDGRERMVITGRWFTRAERDKTLNRLRHATWREGTRFRHHAGML